MSPPWVAPPPGAGPGRIGGVGELGGPPPGQPFAGYSRSKSGRATKPGTNPSPRSTASPSGWRDRTTGPRTPTSPPSTRGTKGTTKPSATASTGRAGSRTSTSRAPRCSPGWGEEEGLDGEEIKKVIAEKRYLGSLHSQRAQGKAAGIYGIPSFVVDGKIFWGVDIIDDVKAAVAGCGRRG